MIGIALFGAGTIGRVHARNVAAHRNCELRYVVDTDLDRAYASSDILVHPALFEGYGMALAEAMAAGLPIVATTGGAAPETVAEGAGLAARRRRRFAPEGL